jgi:hypothetical protein
MNTPKVMSGNNSKRDDRSTKLHKIHADNVQVQTNDGKAIKFNAPFNQPSQLGSEICQRKNAIRFMLK